jgi:hypothetical protein
MLVFVIEQMRLQQDPPAVIFICKENLKGGLANPSHPSKVCRLTRKT